MKIEGWSIVSDPDVLEQPLRWRKPRQIFVAPPPDLFHLDVPDEFIDRVFAVMAFCPQHTFQIWTKQPDRAMWYVSQIPLATSARYIAVNECRMIIDRDPKGATMRPTNQWTRWPLHNVDISSIENLYKGEL